MNIMPSTSESFSHRWRVMGLSTVAFTLMFNVWLMLGVLGISVRKELKLSDSQLEWLIAAAILSGALLRLNAGLWADRFGGRVVMIGLLLITAVPCYLFSQATTYEEMFVCALFFGLAGNAFSIGISWNSAWFPPNLKGVALGVFGAGNVGASGTKLLVVLVPSVLTLVPRPEFWAASFLAVGGHPRVLFLAAGSHGAGTVALDAFTRPQAGARPIARGNARALTADARVAIQPLLRGGLRRLRGPGGLVAQVLHG